MIRVLDNGQYSGNIINASSKDGIITSITSYQQERFDNGLHCHYNTNISFVISGGCLLKKKNNHELLPGKIIFNYAGEPHKVIAVANNSKHVNIEIEPRVFKQYHIEESNASEKVSATAEGKFLMLKIYKELTSADQFSALSVTMLVLDLLHKIDIQKSSRQVPGWVNITKDFLHDNWNKKITLNEIAFIANVHPVTISKYFSIYFEATFGEYMRKLKIERALSLIKTSDTTLTNIAYECGFADQSHFIHTFKQLTGFLPAHYKKL